jgi:hypothetical protein
MNIIGIAAILAAIDAPTAARMVEAPTPGEIVLMAAIGLSAIASGACLLWDQLDRMFGR